MPGTLDCELCDTHVQAIPCSLRHEPAPHATIEQEQKLIAP